MESRKEYLQRQQIAKMENETLNDLRRLGETSLILKSVKERLENNNRLESSDPKYKERIERERRERERLEKERLQREREKRENERIGREINRKYNYIKDDLPEPFYLDDIKLQKLENAKNEQCLICLGKFKLNQQCLYLCCMHLFHSGCIMRWLLEHEECPICKINYKGKQNNFIAGNDNMNNEINNFIGFNFPNMFLLNNSNFHSRGNNRGRGIWRGANRGLQRGRGRGNFGPQRGRGNFRGRGNWRGGNNQRGRGRGRGSTNGSQRGRGTWRGATRGPQRGRGQQRGRGTWRGFNRRPQRGMEMVLEWKKFYGK